jgi:serine/threonine-protein kinase
MVAAPTSSPYCIGDELAGKYRLERKAGEGGMGAVWVATNNALETTVAIKVIHAEGQAFGASERLLREARATATLRHPAVVRVFDYGVTEQNHAFIVMELLEGQSLRDLLQHEGRVAPERAVELLLPIVDGLSAAHGRGIIHRDLKPDNIVLASDDTGRIHPKIVDFGVAKVIRSQTPGITGVTAIGTPEYMSPEQAYALDDIDARADVWALCAVLHELCTDEYVFSGNTYDEVLRKVVDEPTPSLVDKAGVDEELWQIVERGLRKNRDERWASARDLGQALAGWLLSRGITEDVTGASLRAKWFGDTPRAPSDPGLNGPWSSTPRLRPVSERPLGAVVHDQLAETAELSPDRSRVTPAPVATEAGPTEADEAGDVAPYGARSTPTAAASASTARRRRMREVIGTAVVVACCVGWTVLRPSAGAEHTGVAAAAIAPAQVETQGRRDREPAPTAPTANVAAEATAVDTAAAPTSTPAPDRTASPKAKPKATATAPAPGVKKVNPEEVDFGF